MVRDPVKKSLTVVKPLLGGEYGTVKLGGFGVALTTLMIFYGYGFLMAGLVGGGLFMILLRVARALYKADPYLWQVISEYQEYDDFYAGSSSYHHFEPSVKDFTKG